MTTLTINTSLISCAANRSYQTRKETRFLVLHETASPGATARNELAYFNSGPRDANAHGFIDWNEVLLTLPLDEVGWHVGQPANQWTEGYELCHATNTADFAKVWGIATQWFARRCAAYGRGADMIRSHHEIAQQFGGTDHTDPDGYFAAFGKTVDDFRRDVQKILDAQKNPAPQQQAVDLDNEAAADAVKLISAYFTSSRRDDQVALNRAANAIRARAGLPITADLGKPTAAAAQRVEKLLQAMWPLTDNAALQACYSAGAEQMRFDQN
ncbi:N-acetylmuramoyl-L-alanine amidase family protein [Tumebacillus flagellatus]|uniref:N-acetylmuramoyl-L-alanine amidase n=1 Tax=Tumebacillus flagellatus TaxID=1157490 RepID=A0A074M645_9BACL|nr:N-acetylmuramoyl-L-alanine amidase [Tumebacillus flagellatus]KEO81482.1 hypothetical protein EL26_20635 [Tumebacillus flagellatus]